MMGGHAREQVVRALLLSIGLGALAVPAQAQSLQLIGYSGFLGEWELTATVTENASGRQEYAGPVTLKHVGICTQEGPEERTGEILLQRSASLTRLSATLSVDGVECTYSGQLSDSYTGTMSCPDREAVPLRLWVK
jgi:hypothetical protein